MPVAGRPQHFAPQCLQTVADMTAGKPGYDVPDGCGASGALLSDATDVTGSYQLSQMLLQVNPMVD